MPTSEYYWIIKRGETNAVRTGYLRDANGLVTIAGTLVVTATLVGSETPTIDEASCTPDADQVTNKGKFTFTFNSTNANIAAGEYNLEFKNTNGSLVTIWPKSALGEKRYGRLIVQKSLS